MRLLKKLKIRSSKGKRRQIRLLDIPILEYEKRPDKTSYKLFPLCKVKKNEDTVVYLKVKAIRNYSLACIQLWLNVVEHLGYDYYIICDKTDVRDQIEKFLTFPNSNIKFIKSQVSLKQKLFVQKSIHKKWVNAGIAHLTTFYNAKKINTKYFWNIDADDTALLIKEKKIIKILKDAEKYAKDNNILAFSLDMWETWTRSKHWSFGITFTDARANWTKIFDELNIKDMKSYRLDFHRGFTNLDWIFTYLRDVSKINIQTFYVENLRFIHFCDFGGRQRDQGLCYWENGFIHYPMLEYVFKDKTSGCLSIPDNLVKFETDTTNEECLNFYKTRIRGV